MGYPMTYKRVINRNRLLGGYDTAEDSNAPRRPLAGDLRRLERDTLDRNHLPAYAKHAGVTEEQAEKLFRAFFSGDVGYEEGAAWHSWPDDPPGPYGPQWEWAVPKEESS